MVVLTIRLHDGFDFETREMARALWKFITIYVSR